MMADVIKKATRDSYGAALVELGAKRQDLVVLAKPEEFCPLFRIQPVLPDCLSSFQEAAERFHHFLTYSPRHLFTSYRRIILLSAISSLISFYMVKFPSPYVKR